MTNHDSCSIRGVQPRYATIPIGWMIRNAATPMDFFNIRPNRVVELGSQSEI